MAANFDFGRMLEQYLDNNGDQSPSQVEQDFDHVSRNASTDEVADGLNEAFRSDRTPPFPDMLAQMFGQGDAQQRTGMVNQLLGAVGPAVIGSLLGGGIGNAARGNGSTGSGALGDLLSGMLGQQAGQQTQLRPEDVDQLSPDDVREVARHAEQQDHGIIDQMSRFYAQNPEVVKGLGGAALAIALGKIAQRKR